MIADEAARCAGCQRSVIIVRNVVGFHLYVHTERRGDSVVYICVSLPTQAQGSHASWNVMENDCGHVKSWKSHGIPPIVHYHRRIIIFRGLTKLISLDSWQSIVVNVMQ